MNYLSLAVIGSGIAAAWNYIKDFVSRIRSIFIVNIIIEGEANSALLYLLWNEFKKSKMGDRRFAGITKYVNPLKRVQRIGIEKISKQSSVFWRNYKSLIITVQCDSYSNYTEARATIAFIRGMYNIDELLIEALDKYNDYYSIADINKKRNRFKIIKLMGKEQVLNLGEISKTQEMNFPVTSYDGQLERHRILKWNLNDLELTAPINPFQGYFFEPKIEEYIKEVEYWLNSQEFFEKINVPFRRGWTIHSIAGCGKTSLVRAIAQKFDLPIVILDISTMNNHDLTRNWKDAQSHAPCIILIEDIDNIFNLRENISNQKGITFDALLNALAGVEGTTGIFTIITTNNIEKLDGALIRPGRCGDRVIELKPLSNTQKVNMAQHILKECPQFIKEVLNNLENDTPAKFQQKCADIALKFHWDKLKN